MPIKKKPAPKHRSPLARSLESPAFRQRKVPSKKRYDRKKDKPDGLRETEK